MKSSLILRNSLATAALLILGGATKHAAAAQLGEARVTYVVNDVKLLAPQAAPRPATVPEVVRNGTAVRTGLDSRSELTFADLTITRLGANTIFTFDEGTRNLELKDGAILLRVPKNAGGAKITTAAVTAAITGTTVMMEYHPHGFIKAIGLEGTFRMYLRRRLGESVLVHAGQMVILRADATRLSDPVDVDLKELLKSSLLITGFPPLPSYGLIAQAVQAQTEEKAAGELVDTNLAIFGSGTMVSLLNIDDLDQARFATTPPTPLPPPPGPPPPGPPPPPPPPSEFGQPTTITSFVPYPIKSSTVIVTDPTITTDGVTDYGKLYRGPGQDGAFTNYAFGSTSSFDQRINSNGELVTAMNGPIAVFKFVSLSLLGNPTISLGNGGATRLALIAENGITSGPPGGALTWNNLDGLMLATVAGSIALTSDISFQNLPSLFVYARGAGSSLSLASPVIGSNEALLAAQGAMQLGIGITTFNRLKLVSGGDMSVTPASATYSIDNFGDTIDVGGRIAVEVGGDFTSNGNVKFIVQNTAGTIGTGGDITFTTQGNVFAGGGFGLLVENYNQTANPAGHIGSGGNVLFSTGGNFTADFATFALNNRGGGTVDSDVQLLVNIGGVLKTLTNGPDFLDNAGSLSIAISTRFDDQAGNTKASAIGGNAALQLNAASASIGGNLSVFLSDRGGSIGGDALLTADIRQDLVVTGTDATSNIATADIELLNDSGPPITGAGTPLGGTIHGDATLQISAAGLSVPNGSLFVRLNNRNNAVTGGRIDGAVGLGIEVTDALVTGGDFIALVLNERGGAATGLSGGSIGGNASLKVGSDTMSVGGALDIELTNSNNGDPSGTGGTIGGIALLTFNATQVAVNSFVDNAVFRIDNHSGKIGADALLTLNVGSLSTKSSVVVQIDNNGGQIGGVANLNVNAGVLNIVGDGYFAITNIGGTIDSDAVVTLTAKDMTVGENLTAGVDNTNGIMVNEKLNVNVSGKVNVGNNLNFELVGTGPGQGALNVTGGSYTVAGTFLGEIEGLGSMTFNNVNVAANALHLGALGEGGVLNIGGGTLSAEATLKLYAGGLGGQLNFVANVTLSGNSTKYLVADTITIFNGVTVTINGPAEAIVYTNNANYSGSGGNGSTTGTFGGTGALAPQSPANAPPFPDPPLPPPPGSKTTTTASTSTTATKTSTTAVLNIMNTDQLLALLDRSPTVGGKIAVPGRLTARELKTDARADARDHAQRGRSAVERRLGPRPF